MTDALWAGTFLGVGARLLRDYAGGIGLDPAFTIHDREDSAGVQTEQSRENQNATVAILNVGGMNHRMKQEAYGIDEDVTLLAFDLLACIIAIRVDAAPLFPRL
jgi:superfamily I DNA/RNA helicase